MGWQIVGQISRGKWIRQVSFLAPVAFSAPFWSSEKGTHHSQCMKYTHRWQFNILLCQSSWDWKKSKFSIQLERYKSRVCNEDEGYEKNMKQFWEDKVGDICLVAAKSKWFKEKRIRPYVRLLALTGAVLEQRHENTLEFCQELYLTLI